MNTYPSQELNSLRKSGQTDASYKRGQELLRKFPNDKFLKGSYGWVLYDKIKAIVDKSPSEGPVSEGVHEKIRLLFREYATLGLDRPDLLFSFMIIQLLRLPDLPPFSPQILLWAGIESFREEDFQFGKVDDSGKKYPSLIERLALGIGKTITAHPKKYDHPILEFSIQLIETALDKAQISEPIWLRYRMGQILSELGKHELARKHLLFVVKKKHEEFWAWHALAQCERNNSTSTALSLCSKAYVAAGDKKLTVGVLEDLTQLALDTKQLELAKWAIDQHFSLRQTSGWNIPESVKTHLSADWYSNTDELKNPEKTLEKHAKSAESLLFEGKWHEVNFLEIFTTKTGIQKMKLAYKANSKSSLDVITPTKNYGDLISLESGTPLDAVIDFDDSRARVLSLKKRPNGKPFDCLMEVRGVLDHHNTKKGLASVFISPSDYCLLQYSKFKDVQDWEPGYMIVLSCTLYDKKYNVFQARRGAFQKSQWIVQKTDILRVHEKGFGFVDDVYVHPNLIKNILNETKVTVIAIKKPKSKQDLRELTWKAVSLKLIPEDSE